ncbi:MAG: flagellar basal body P-ring protein FlgI [Planctomycetaceae bacterium]|jgi:flagellar P-ring protein precursor FlgI|nr:flagellar basal body P-ring protein FlgI [Planctomycetaceae bacterium]
MKKLILLFLVTWITVGEAGVSRAALTVGMVTHVKGQETNVLTGIGLVVGLNGTGDKKLSETARSLANALRHFGHLEMSVEELARNKNVALVSVTATVPGAGAREGDLIDCQVASIGSAASLRGGQLLVTSMLGPVPAKSPEDAQVFATSSGLLTLEDAATPTVAVISKGCRLEDDFFNPFVKDGLITLVIDSRYAGWEMARAVATAVDQDSPDGVRRAQTLNQNNVAVMLPEYEDPVTFIADFMKNELIVTFKIPTVVINKRKGLITFDGNVEITPTAITHGDLTIAVAPLPAEGQAANPQPAGPRIEHFVGIDTESARNKAENPRLDALLQSLNAISVPAEDIIAIIEALDQQGNLHGRIQYK